jgi:solute:Na+ symporter, SSS family
VSTLDWILLVGTIVFIAGYGTWKTRGIKNIEGYFRGDNSEGWLTIGLSIMATQASAITFLSMPGQAYEDGMRFVQFYFGLPLAMVILSIFVVPIYYRSKVFTAYEYLEKRFDLKTRQLTAFLFLVQRGIATGITIYAPAIILSSVLGWSLSLTNLSIGVLVTIYTVSGGTKAVSQTQKQQMAVMLGGMVLAFVFIVLHLPERVSLANAWRIAGGLGRVNAVDFHLDFDTRYNFWSGIAGGLFLALSYFGTDQSQVQRYLSGRSIAESRLGLLFNGLLKVPMQFLILAVGVMVFVFYQFEEPPAFFNRAELERAQAGTGGGPLKALEREWSDSFARKRSEIERFVAAIDGGDEATARDAKERMRDAEKEARDVRSRVKAAIQVANPRAETNDADYVFITFVMGHLPEGLVGLLLAVIFCAAMSATASELTALGSTTVVDFYKRSFKPDASEGHYLRAGKMFTVIWGVLAVAFAMFADLIDNLIQAVNILGSIFYGTILGVFLAGFFVARIRGTAVFAAAVVSQAIVVLVFAATSIGFLWYNVIGCAAVLVLALAIEGFGPKPPAG